MVDAGHVPHYWPADQMQRLLDSLAAHSRHKAGSAALIMWQMGLRVSQVLELEWRDLGHSGGPGTVRLHPELVQLFTNWLANRSPRDKVVSLSMRTALRHIGAGSSPRAWVRSRLGLGIGPPALTA